jgi:hypothetical protein
MMIVQGHEDYIRDSYTNAIVFKGNKPTTTTTIKNNMSIQNLMEIERLKTEIVEIKSVLEQLLENQK